MTDSNARHSPIPPFIKNLIDQGYVAQSYAADKAKKASAVGTGVAQRAVSPAGSVGQDGGKKKKGKD